MNDIKGVDVSREAFALMNSEERDAIIFDALKTISKDVAELKSSEKTNKKEIMWIGGVFGFLGGVLVTLAKLFFP